MKKVLRQIVKAIKNRISHKERFLRACAFNFYIRQARTELNGVGFLPFINAKNRHDWAKLKANEFVNYCKKHNIINECYKLALQYAKSL